ncbi:hypothetical protein, partial [Xanthomonas campestris]|uniref:hypothetical protein n=1 Tax=Xanthomonas campestris TaxID=339 RepID=UPI002AD2DF1D
RGGQLYFLHNDVESIVRMQRDLSELDEQLQPLTCLFLSTELAWQYGHMGDEHILGGCLLRSKEAHNEHILALELQDSGSSATLLN